MPLLDLAIPHLLGGVSQQPPAGRQPGQVEACDNAILHVVNGLSKRAGTRHLARLFTGLESVRLVHWINRDVAERYAVLLGERRVRVFDADTGGEFPVKVNGTSTNAGRGKATAGTPINYLDPRVQRGIVDQDEDFVIGAGDWLSVVGNSVTSYVSGRGPFLFGRRESTAAVTADTVAEVGNGAAASISDIHQAFGNFSRLQSFSVYVKKGATTANDVELAFTHAAGADVIGARFDIAANGVVTVGSSSVTAGAFLGSLRATVEAADNGWYRCTIQHSYRNADSLAAIVGSARDIRIRFHTNAATPANKHVLLFGARVYDLLETRTESLLINEPLQAVPDYIYDRSDLFRALTIADNTYLLNTGTVVGATDTPSASVPGGGVMAGVFVKTAVHDTIYTLVLTATDTTVTTYTVTSAASGADDTVDIVALLMAAINGGGGLYTAAANIGSTFAIYNGTKTLGSIAATDGQGDKLMIAFMLTGGTVRNFSDLPTEFAVTLGSVKIVGQDQTPLNDFYARFRFTNNYSTHDGYWQETIAPATNQALDETTLPQVLSRRQDDAAGTITGVPNSIYFDVSAVVWDRRLVGDTLTNPDPGFVGQRINDLFLYRGRLGFLSQDSVILSEAGEILNFWRTTVRSLPDTDPIEVANATSYDELRNAAPGGDIMVISSQRRQFQLVGEPVLTPATAQLVPLRNFEFLASARAADTGHGTLFARLDGGNSGLVEVSLRGDNLLAAFEELTAQAPRYIAGEAIEIAHSSLTHLTALRAGDATILYLHQAFFDDQENRLQSAPHRWIFQADTLIRGIAFFEEQLKQVVERAEGWFLEEQPTGTEILETATGLPLTHLDRRLTEDQVTRAYDGGTDRTTITLPYNIPSGATMQVVEAASGLLVPIVSQTTTTLVVSGDLTATDLLIGESFEMRVRPTRPVIQEQGPRGGLTPRLSHPTDVRQLELYLADTAFLRVEVATDLRDPSSEEFSAAGLGTGELGMGQLNTYTGRAGFGIYAEAAEMELDLVNSTPFPSRVQAGRWTVLNSVRAGLA